MAEAFEPKRVDELADRAPLGTDFLPVTPTGGPSGRATLAQVIQSGLPTGNAHADLLAWSTSTNSWAPLPTELAVLHGLPAFTTSDNGKALTVKTDGTGVEWKEGIPAYTAGTDAGKALIVTNEGTAQWTPLVREGDWVKTLIANKTANNLQVKCGNVAEINTNVPAVGITGGLYFDDLVSAISVNVSNTENATLLSFANMRVCHGSFAVFANKKVREIYAYNISSLSNVTIRDNPELETITFKYGQTAGVGGLDTETINIKNNPKLRSISNFLFWKVIRGSIDFSGNAITDVNTILNTMANAVDGNFNPYGQGRTVNLSGGTNAAPTGQGIIDAQTLLARGCTVTVNGTPITTTKKSTFTIPDFDTVADKGKTLKVKADGTGLEWTSRAYTGDYVATPLSGQTGVTLFNLLSITGSFTVSSNSTITSIDLGQLQRLGGSFLNTAANCPELTSISGPNLTDAFGNWWFTGSAKLTTFSFPYLRTARTFVLTGFGVTQFSLPALELMDDSLELYNFPELSSINFQRLQIVSNQFRLSNIPKLTGASFNQLKKVGWDIKFENCGALTYVSLESLESIGGNLDFQSGTPNLSSFTLNEGFSRCGIAGKRVLFTSCALNQASVDGLLIRLAALDGTGGTAIFSNRIVTITGTSAAPSAAGVTAKNTLVARGCTVTHN